MKKTILFLFLILTATISYAQRPVDSLYIWVHFQDNAIVLDIPASYFHLRTQVPALPSYVNIRNMQISVPELPASEVLLQTLSEKLAQADKAKTATAQLDYLRTVVLYLYFSNNDLSHLPAQVNEILNKWQANPASAEIQSTFKLVKQYLAFTVQ